MQHVFYLVAVNLDITHNGCCALDRRAFIVKVHTGCCIQVKDGEASDLLLDVTRQE